jgi:hypothetical protein
LVPSYYAAAGALLSALLDYFHRAVVVAVVAVRVVQLPVHQVVHVIAVRHRFVPAAWAVLMAMVMPGVSRVAAVRIGRAHLEDMLVNVPAVRVVQMSIVQVVHMVTVLHCSVAAVVSVIVRMVLVDVAIAHKLALLHFLSPVASEPKRFRPSRFEEHVDRASSVGGSMSSDAKKIKPAAPK